MCYYWRKLYTCGCLSSLHLQLCKSCLLNRTVCDKTTINEKPEPRKSYFQCYDCIIRQFREEKAATIQAKFLAAEANKRAAEEAAMAKAKADKIEKEKRIQREAEGKAEGEHQNDVRKEQELEEQFEREKWEGGAWNAVGAHKKGRGRGKRGVALMPSLLVTTKTLGQVDMPAGMDPGGRAGHWGHRQNGSCGK